MGKRTKVESGDVYGRLTVVREVEPAISGKQRQRCVECRCECGVVGVYRLYTLRSGNTRSCGCLARDLAGSGMTTHGLSGSPEYAVWNGMLRRCGHRDSSGHSCYKGRGIVVCQRWRDSVKAFYDDMGPRPSDKHSIDRIDNDGNYSCGHCEECVANGWVSNCRWATRKEQSRNTRRNYLIEHDGETKCVGEWAEQYGIRASILYGRLVVLGWTFEKAVRWPVNKRRESRASDPFYQIPMRDRDASWHREHRRKEVVRIARDRRELELVGDDLARSHRLDAVEFKSRVDKALVEGWTWKGSVLRALREMGAVK